MEKTILLAMGVAPRPSVGEFKALDIIPEST